MNKMVKDFLIWFLPVILLIIALLPMPIMVFYSLLVQIVVGVTSAIIIYYLVMLKPKYYIAWVIAFALIFLIFNPLIKIYVMMSAIPLALITAAIYLANWYFVFKTRP